MIPQITDPDDEAMIESMEGTVVRGRIVLPSGLEIPNPPPAKCWRVVDGKLTIIDEECDA